jgi:large subunit ribosomal protein L25
MMMGDVKFAVEARDTKGKGPARRLRARGLAPGVVYGSGKEATPIAFDVDQLERLLASSHGGHNSLIDLEGDSNAAGKTVIAKEFQREAIRGRIIHGDFFEVNLKEKILVSVPIHLTGSPAGVLLGGVLDQQLREVELLCLPTSIPDDLHADVSALELGDSFHLDQLTLPEGIEMHTDPSLTVATVLVPRGLKEGEGEVAEEETEEETKAEKAEESKEESDD